MHRITCTLILFSLCVLTVAGCRRGLSAPRAPTKNHREEDMFQTRREQEVALSGRPKDRKMVIWLDEGVKSLRQKETKDSTFWKKIGASQKKAEEDKESQEMVSKAKEAVEKSNREDEFVGFGNACLEYLDKAPRKEHSEENGLKWMRRNNKFYSRKWLDGIDGILFEERLWYHELIRSKQASFIPFVDRKDIGHQYLVATTESTGGGGMMGGDGGGGGGGGGPNAFYTDGVKAYTGTVKGVPNIMKQQELRILHRYFMVYRAPLREDKGQFPMYKDFISHLNANAPIALLDDIKNQYVYIHEPADGVLRGNLACRTDQPIWTVNVSGMIFQSGGSPFPVKLPTPIKKADKDDNKDGMPGMPMPGGGQ